MSDVDEKMFSEAETSFGLNFLNTLPANQSLVFSPLSIALALSLVHSGAKGKSKEQIGDVLLKGASDEQLVSHFQFISESLKESAEGVKVNVANRVYLKNGFNVESNYLTTVKKNFNAVAENLDFTSSESVEKINNFVKTATDGKIDNLVCQDTLKDAVALLVNAIYFKGDWEDKFDGYSIYDREFTQNSGKTVKIPFIVEHMYGRDYSSDDVFQVLVLPYKDSNYRFAIFLPKVKNGLGEAMKKLDAAKFQKLLSTAKDTHLNTIFPKFTVEKELSLKESLTKLGISDIFSNSADLSAMAKNVKISDGAHKAVIEVTEEGTIAAAATMAKAVPMSARMEGPIDFIADHPFLFTLVRESHPIFLGVFHG